MQVIVLNAPAYPIELNEMPNEKKGVIEIDMLNHYGTWTSVPKLLLKVAFTKKERLVDVQHLVGRLSSSWNWKK